MAKLEFFPEEQRILVKPDESQDIKTKGGIIIPGTTQPEKPEIATVVRVGKGSEDIKMRYKVGDRIMYSQYSGVEMHLDLVGDGYGTYKVMNQMDVMGLVIEVKEEEK